METERTHHVHFEEPEEREKFDTAFFPPSTHTSVVRGEGMEANPST